MAKARYKNLVDKSVQASIAAIEIYNKPDFKYREETFSILMINAWELLFKAKILLDNDGKLNSICVPEKTKSRKGERLKRFYPKRNRSGNPYTLSIFEVLNLLDVEMTLKENINLLVEIRDNAIHFMNDCVEFEKIVLEVGTATLKGYVALVSEWFDCDLSKYNFYLMPISFFHTFEMDSFSINSKDKQRENFFAYFSNKLSKYPADLNSSYNVALKLETKFERSSSEEALPVKYAQDSPLIVKQEIENRIRDGLRSGSLFDYQEFIARLKDKIPAFKLNQDFHDKCKILKNDDRFVIVRYLDPVKKTGQPKYFWKSESIKEMVELYKTK